MTFDEEQTRHLKFIVDLCRIKGFIEGTYQGKSEGTQYTQKLDIMIDWHYNALSSNGKQINADSAQRVGFNAQNISKLETGVRP